MQKRKYNSELLGLPGIDYEFKCCHIPFLVVNDVFGALALEGSSGTGKTTLINRLGKLNEAITGGKVKAYSADKVRYEDFNGCPIPNSESKTMDIYFMPNSISQMETVLIDEINRASYDNQEKFLSLLSSREIDGLPSKCKYIFTAMNPILSEDNDVYEGVQPIDKALGERMLGLIKMTPFSKLPVDVRLKIIQSCFSQVNWLPSEEAQESFKDFITRAREIYEEAKYKYAAEVSNYIDSVQLDIVKETKNAFKIEARRAQYIMVNILAMYALDSVFNNGSIKLDSSALSALLISFPNPLWEQPINKEALKQAHNRSKYLLEGAAKGTIRSKNLIERSLKEIELFISKDPLPSKEQLSKLINQSIPPEEIDPIGHHIYCCGAVLGLTLDRTKNSKRQSVMKEQEFSRLETVNAKVENSIEVKLLKEVVDYYEKNSKLPTTFKLPEFIWSTENQEDTIKEFTQVLSISFARTVLGICNICKYETQGLEELSALMTSFVDTTKLFKEIKEKYEVTK